jgi:hypothetical protein
MPGQPPGDRAIVLACSVRSLRRYWLEVRCVCKTMRIPLRMLDRKLTVELMRLGVF